jgi:hypothetical protein
MLFQIVLYRGSRNYFRTDVSAYRPINGIFTWGEGEVKQLLDDYQNAIDSHQESYFLGLLVFLQQKDGTFTILDGQQRLATIVIIFAAIRDWLTQYSDLKADAEKIQSWFIGSSELGATEPTPKLTLNTANNQIFLDYVVKSRAIEDLQKHIKNLKRQDPNQSLLEAIFYAHKRVREIVDSSKSPSENAKTLFDLVIYFRDKVRVVQLIVGSESAAYTIFETLNDRGVDLSPLDLVKNFLFGKAAEQSPISLRDIQARWVQMIATLANVKASGFLKAFWTSRYGRTRSGVLFDNLRVEFNKPDNAIQLSIDLLAGAEQYAGLDSPEDPIWAEYSPEAKRTIAALKIIGNQQVHPVMLAGLARFDVSGMQDLLRLLEVVIVRFMLITGGNPGRFEPVCAGLAKAIYATEIRTAKAAFQELKNKELYPLDDDFEANFRVKFERNSHKARYFLKRLELQAQIEAKGKMGNEWETVSPTLEHILPRKPGTEWKSVTDADPDIVEDFVNRLGNLCLLTDINRDLGSKGFAHKRGIFAKSDLITTKELAEVDEWNRAAIAERQERMAKRALSIWRFA